MSGAVLDVENYSTLAAILSLNVFPVSSFVIEILAAKGVPDLFVISMIFSTLLVMLAYPVVMIQYLKSDTLSAVYFMMFSTGLFLKLFSFHHVMYDNRTLIYRISKLPKDDQRTKAHLSHFMNVSVD